MSKNLCLWSGPRNISTAMMRSFGSRSDMTCWDEPFFAPYLDQTGLEHPGRAETLAECETDPDRVVERILAPVDTRYHFQKHMAHHMISGMPTDWMVDARHVLLLRHPARVIASYAKGRPDFTADDLGFSRLRTLHSELIAMTGRAPLVVDSDDILARPRISLRTICEDGFNIPFDRAMLKWHDGPRDEDGPWAPYWYANVIKSFGFGDAPGALPDVAPEHAEIYEACLRDYQVLRTL
jgi:hypothetical protein